MNVEWANSSLQLQLPNCPDNLTMRPDIWVHMEVGGPPAVIVLIYNNQIEPNEDFDPYQSHVRPRLRKIIRHVPFNNLRRVHLDLTLSEDHRTIQGRRYIQPITIFQMELREKKGKDFKFNTHAFDHELDCWLADLMSHYIDF